LTCAADARGERRRRGRASVESEANMIGIYRFVQDVVGLVVVYMFKFR
jgi:hypothetical protein